MSRKDKKEIPICPICDEPLSYMMPSGITLYCNKCDKYFQNIKGMVGEECGSPYTNNNVLY